jgi:aconitate hydratase
LRLPVRLAYQRIAIAAIASCTNTANPYRVIAAGLLARKAVAKGLRAKPWVRNGAYVMNELAAQ